MGTIVIGSPSDKKGITVNPSKIMFNANNVKKMMQGNDVIWIAEPIALVPVMTSNTSPSGIAKADSGTSVALAYYAFDNDESTHWASSIGAGSWLEYCFATGKTAKTFYIKAGYSTNDSGVSGVKSFKIQGSNNETQWIDLTDAITLPNKNGAEYTGELKNISNYKYYRFYATTNAYASSNWVAVKTLQLYEQ